MTATATTHELIGKWCKAVGITSENVHRVVVDMQVGEVVNVYVEQWGDTAMNALDPPKVSMAVVVAGPGVKIDTKLIKAKPCTSPNDRL